MNLKIKLLSALLFISGSLLAQDNLKGIEYYKAELVGPAKMLLLENFQNGNTDKEELGYYLGEIYFEENKLDSAALFYKAGLQANPESLRLQLGLLKLDLKSNPAATEKSFSELLKGKNKRNSELLTEFGKTYLKINPVKAGEYLDQAIEADKKNARAYVLRGDLYATIYKRLGDACNQYEQALYYDPNTKEAYIKYARVYVSVNPDLCAQMLEKLLAIDPESVIAQRELSNVYFATGQFAKAKKAYDVYIQHGYPTQQDINRYATILYYDKDYEQSLEIARKTLVKEPNNFVMRRLSMYNLVELERSDEALPIAESLVNSADSAELICPDYAYYGRILLHAKRINEAALVLEKVVCMDSSKIEFYKELGAIYDQTGAYKKAIQRYTDYINKGTLSQKVMISDYLTLGKSYYFATTALDSTVENQRLKKAYAKTADSLFAYVVEKVPDNFNGYLWRARINSVLDPETELGLAKPFYEKAIELLSLEDKRHCKMFIEAYSYLGYYYYIKKDNENSKKYWNKILAIDPSNELATRALAGIK